MTPLHENAGPSVVARRVIVEPSVASERKQPSDSEDVQESRRKGASSFFIEKRQRPTFGLFT